jgi:hypothetical protein
MRVGVATARAARLDPPAPGSGLLQRAGYGFGLPFAILRSLWRNAAARRSYLRITLAQLAVALAITATVISCSHLEEGGDRNVRFFIGDDGVELASNTERTQEPDPPEAAEGSDERPSDRQRLRKATPGSAPAPAEPPAGGIERARAWLRDRLGGAASFWSEVVATLTVVEWIVIALSREYHDALSKTASELTAVPPEELPYRPSIRLNLRWLWKKAKRRIRGALLVAAGAPALWPTLLLGGGAAWVQTAALGAFGVYWLLVFTVGKTEHAWNCPSPPAPWFVRLAERAAAHRVLRFWIWSWYARLLRRGSAPLFSPAAHFERAPCEVAGLGLARAITRLPILYTFFRPLIPVAATHIVVGPGRLPGPAAA